MDSLGLECVKNLDPDRLERMLADGKVEACGGGPTVAVLKAAIELGANRVRILRYGDSGDLTGDKSSVVGYLAAVVYKSGEEADMSSQSADPKDSHPDKNSGGESYLTDSEKDQLLAIARQSIEQYLAQDEPAPFEAKGVLADPGAAFVTLEKHGNLRGCIGYTVAVKPLHQTVAECAIQAAASDPRFPPVTKDELDDLDIEISVLTPLETVESLDDIVVGRDGLMITMGSYRGLLLPQVATEYGWTREEFLENTCRKAGLPPDAYKSDKAVIESFQALIFHE
jgi:AmmeMemoRadiSam system protein A